MPRARVLDLDAICKRTKAATRGPWKTGDKFGRGTLGPSVAVISGKLPPVELDPYRNGEADAAFIAHARQDIPALLAEIARLRAELHQARRVNGSNSSTGGGS